jgi:hypothetical protein
VRELIPDNPDAAYASMMMTMKPDRLHKGPTNQPFIQIVRARTDREKHPLLSLESHS